MQARDCYARRSLPQAPSYSLSHPPSSSMRGPTLNQASIHFIHTVTCFAARISASASPHAAIATRPMAPRRGPLLTSNQASQNGSEPTIYYFLSDYLFEDCTKTFVPTSRYSLSRTCISYQKRSVGAIFLSNQASFESQYSFSSVSVILLSNVTRSNKYEETARISTPSLDLSRLLN